MDLIKQTAMGECGPACVATVAGISLAAAKNLIGNTEYGCTDDCVVRVLEGLGLAARVSLDWPDLDVSAILTVPSLNHRGLLHYIVWDAEQQRILDPSHEGLRYPDDGYVLRGDLLFPQWATTILLYGHRTKRRGRAI